MLSPMSNKETAKAIYPVSFSDQDYFTVYRCLLSKVKEKGIKVCESYQFQNDEVTPSMMIFFFGTNDTVIGLNQSSTIQERARSLACCFVLYMLPGGWEKASHVSGSTYCWMEAIGGQRDPEIDRISDRYLSFLLYKARQQSKSLSTFPINYSLSRSAGLA